MKRSLLIGLLGLSLAACASRTYIPPEHPVPQEATIAPPAHDPLPAEVSSSSSSKAEVHTVVLVDQTFETARDVTGAARLKAMRVQKIVGNIRNASLHFTLSRNGQNEGVAGVTMYLADLMEVNDKLSVNPATEWKRFRAVGASWAGNGRCMIAKDSELLSGAGESVEAAFPLSMVPVSSEQPACEAGVTDVDLEGRINATGIALGFLPTNPGYHLTVSLSYEGDLTMKPW